MRSYRAVALFIVGFATAGGCSHDGPINPGVYEVEQWRQSDHQPVSLQAPDGTYEVFYNHAFMVLDDDEAVWVNNRVASSQDRQQQQSYPDRPIVGPWHQHTWEGLFCCSTYSLRSENGWWVLRMQDETADIISVLHPLDVDWQRLALGLEDDPYQPGDTILTLVVSETP